MDENNLLELNGSVERIIYRNEKNGYTVLEIISGDEINTAVGLMSNVEAGEELKLIGQWKNHINFGRQFSVQAFEVKLPSESTAILKYLSSGAIKGIGKKTAQRLVDEFGEHTLEIMQKEPERLVSIHGITKEKALKISEELKHVFGIKELMLSLAKYSITPEESIKIFKAYGANSLDIIRSNPYCICNYPINIPFERADDIAFSLDLTYDNKYRIRAAIVYILRHNMRNGHTCLPKDRLIQATSSFLEIEYDIISDILEEMKEDMSLVEDTLDEREFIFLPETYRCETQIASRLLMMLQFPPQSILGAENEIAKIESEQNIEYASLQKKAISEALKLGMLVLTGGPGTGKTTTLNAIINILKKSGEKVFLAAPTGKAAKRMSELTGEDAKTIHRLLEVEWTENDEPVFQKNEKNLLKCDAVILDELSMIDIKLFDAILRSMPLGCRLIMVGDTDQLPSVGVGNVLGDIIASGILPVVSLKEIFRQSLKSLIVTNAHKIVAGENPELDCKNNDFFFMSRNNSTDVVNTIVDLYKTRLPNAYNYSPLYDIQILCPSKKGETGTKNLNSSIQEAINPPSADKKEVIVNSVVLRENDKVMQTKNNYNIPWAKEDSTSGEGIFNGDVGILINIDPVAGSLAVQYDDKIAIYDLDSAVDLELAYAITVHKSQGSEFEAVIIPLFSGPPQLYYRNLLYTAVTRAKTRLVIVGSKYAVDKMVQNDKNIRRYSGLCYFLQRS